MLAGSKVTKVPIHIPPWEEGKGGGRFYTMALDVTNTNVQVHPKEQYVTWAKTDTVYRSGNFHVVKLVLLFFHVKILSWSSTHM